LIDLLVLYTSGSLFTIFTLFVNIFICAVVSRWCRAVKSVTREEVRQSEERSDELTTPSQSTKTARTRTSV
jgi:hypothetical protein